MYSEEEYHRALEVYEETKSVTRTIAILGYPVRRQTLYNWINRKRMLPEEKCSFLNVVFTNFILSELAFLALFFAKFILPYLSSVRSDFGSFRVLLFHPHDS